MPIANTRFENLDLQERDFSLFRGLFESRVMTAEHIAILYFEGKHQAAKKRLQKLKAAELIGERPRRAFEPSILFLTRKAFDVLREGGVLAEYPTLPPSALDKRSSVSALTLRHELEIMDVKAAFYSAIKNTRQFALPEFSTWPLLYQFEARRAGFDAAEVLVKPDGFIRIHEEERDGGASEHAFFLEVDRSTETQDTLVTRAGCYLDYFKSGGFAVRNGAPPSAYKGFPFRVLMVFKTAERRNNTAERLLLSNPPIFTQVCLSTLDEVTADPLGAVWIRPLDYREATQNSPFALVEGRTVWGYKRQSARDQFIERTVKKFRILAD